MTTIPFIDLTQRPPRAGRCKLGGFVILPRILDKGRATAAGKNGEFYYDCPLDKHFFEFAGVDATALMEEIKAGKSDSEILEWISANGKNKRAAWEIKAWSEFHLQRGPTSDVETAEFFTSKVKEMAPTREDINTWFDLLDLDDYTTYGGKA